MTLPLFRHSDSVAPQKYYSKFMKCFQNRDDAWVTELLLYVQEVVTLQKKYLIYLHRKMRFTPFINNYNILG